MSFHMTSCVQVIATDVFAMQAIELSGKSQFPFLIDPNNGKQMLESDAIINYLWNEYGDGQVCTWLWLDQRALLLVAHVLTWNDDVCDPGCLANLRLQLSLNSNELPELSVQVPLQFKLGPVTVLSIGLGLLARGGRGTTYTKSRLPEKPIEIWGYEASPFVKLAREVRNTPVGTAWRTIGNMLAYCMNVGR
jgi:hypothetical protein